MLARRSTSSSALPSRSRHSGAKLWFLDEAFEFAAQHGQGRAQLVRRIGHETARVLEGLIQAFDHVVERDGQALQFVARPGDRQALAEVLRTDPLSAGGNLVHRQERSFHQTGSRRPTPPPPRPGAPPGRDSATWRK